MIVGKFYLTWVILILSLFVCARTEGQDSSSVGIVINEVYFENPLADSNKFYRKKKDRSYIELYNQSIEKISSENLFFTNDKKQSFFYPIVNYKSNTNIKHKQFLVVYFTETNKRKHARTYYNPDGKTLYLFWRDHGKAVLVDSILSSGKGKFPFSRYPDGKNFVTLDAITRGSENAFFKDTEAKKKIGFTLHGGRATSYSSEFQNSSKYTSAFALGIFYIKAHKYFSIERSIRYGVRGYGIYYHATVPTHTGVRKFDTKGKQTLHYLDFSYYINHRLIKALSFYYGGMLSIRTKSVLKYDQKITFTYNSTGQVIETSTSYTFRNHNSALDFIDIAYVVGLKYHLSEQVNLSFYFTHDIVGINSNSFSGSTNSNNVQQHNNGFYLALDVPIFKSANRIKSKRWIK